MSVYMTETLPDPWYAWTDPPAFLACDAPACDLPWVPATGLVSWRLAGPWPSDSRWSDTFVVGCNQACLQAAQRRHGPRAHWSAPIALREWLDALRASLDYDPTETPIGEIVRAE